MNHVELHEKMSKTFIKLTTGEMKPQLAKEIFNGAGKIINNCRNELTAISMGIPLDVPLLEIKQVDCEKLGIVGTKEAKKLASKA